MNKDAIRESYIGDEHGHIYFFYRPKSTTAIFQDLRLLRDRFPVKPLFSGKWE